VNGLGSFTMTVRLWREMAATRVSVRRVRLYVQPLSIVQSTHDFVLLSSC